MDDTISNVIRIRPAVRLHIPDTSEHTNATEMRLAMSFIEEMGTPQRALRILTAACNVLKTVNEFEDESANSQ